MDKQQGLLYSARNYVRYPVINHNGKEYGKEYIYYILALLNELMYEMQNVKMY